MIYCIDTSALIAGWNELYRPKNFPTLWEKLQERIKKKELTSPDEVFNELKKKDTELQKWCGKQSGLFEPLSEELQQVTAEVLTQFPRLVGRNKNRGQADPFIVALARIRSCTVVTNEGRGSQRKPHIPDVCDFYKIRSINFSDLIQNEFNWKFT